MKYLSVKNLERYQHYKDRNPPWVKLYRETLNDYKLRQVPVPARLFFLFCLLLASETENRIPYDLKYLSDRCGFPITEVLVNSLITYEFLLAECLQDASTTLATCNMLYSDSVSVSSLSPNGIGESERKGRGKRAINEDDKPTEKHFNLAKTLGIDLGPEWGKFKNYCKAHDKRYADFEAAFRNWLANASDMKARSHVVR